MTARESIGKAVTCSVSDYVAMLSEYSEHFNNFFPTFLKQQETHLAIFFLPAALGAGDVYLCVTHKAAAS